jgi:hypothetical protein
MYLDAAVVDWLIPKADFYNYLRALIDAGFEKRKCMALMKWFGVMRSACQLRILKTPRFSQSPKNRTFFTITRQPFLISGNHSNF